MPRVCAITGKKTVSQTTSKRKGSPKRKGGVGLKQVGVHKRTFKPNLVKKTIVGAGHGEKPQIRMMVGVLLPKADPQSEDAADALAIAVTHAHHRSSALLKAAAR